jgi:hypothetical protein
VAADIHSLALALDVAPKSKTGTLASIPASGQSAGDIYEVVGDAAATNNGLGLIYNGAAWIALNQFRLVSQVASVSQTAAVGALYNCAAGITLTLPTAQAGQIVGVVASGAVSSSSPVTVARGGGATLYGVGFSGATSFTLGMPNAHAILYSDGTNWVLISGQQDTGWISLSLASGFIAGGLAPAARCVGDCVWLCGTVHNNTGGTVTTGTTWATVPAACQPTLDNTYAVIGNPSTGGPINAYIISASGSPAGALQNNGSVIVNQSMVLDSWRYRRA